MPIKLRITKESDAKWHYTQVFNKDSISIGRDFSNNLQLVSEKSAVSRQHAKIERHGDTCQVIDLNSRNFTYLNEEKLKGEEEYDLKNGDLIKICEFTLQFSVEKKRIEDVERTILEHPNPFLKDAIVLGTTVNRICRRFEMQESSRKSEDLNEAVQESLNNLKLNIAGKIIANVLRTQAESTTKTPVEVDKIEQKPQAIPSLNNMQKMIDTTLKFFVRLIQARRQFRFEFIGETMIKSSKDFSIHTCSAEELKNYLFDSKIPPKESQRRIDQIKYITDEIMLHQVALLDGYKASVEKGSRLLLEKTDPDVLRKHLSERRINLGPIKIPFSSLPIINAYKLVQLFSDAHRELSQEDQSIIEKKYFRHSYVRSYNKRMDSPKREDEES